MLFRARDVARSEVVALRLRRTENVHSGEAGTGAPIESVIAAATSLAALPPHRHVVRVYDAGVVDNTAFVSTEFVDGVALSALLHDGVAFEPAQVAAIARQSLRGLKALHTHGVLHGQMNARRLLVTRAGVVKVAMAGARGNAGAGTEYVAPELLIGGAPSAQSDLYALGVVLHECLTGRTPFTSHDFIDLLGAKLTATPPVGTAVPTPRTMVQVTAGSPRPTELHTLLRAMTHADVTRRPASADTALQEWIGVGRLSAVLR